MVHRERIRTWKAQSIEVMALAANTTQNLGLVEKVGEECDELLGMVLHRDGAYTLTAKVAKVESRSTSDIELLKMLDKKLDDG